MTRFRCGTCDAHMGLLSKSYDVGKVLLGCTNINCSSYNLEWSVQESLVLEEEE